MPTTRRGIALSLLSLPLSRTTAAGYRCARTGLGGGRSPASSLPRTFLHQARKPRPRQSARRRTSELVQWIPDHSCISRSARYLCNQWLYRRLDSCALARAELGDLPKLQYLSLGANELTGPFPRELIGLPLARFVWASTELRAPPDDGFQQWVEWTYTHVGGGRSFPEGWCQR